MKNEKNKKVLKIVVTVALIGLFVWLIIIYPLMYFRGNEKSLKEAAERYYEINISKLPTGQRVSTVTLKELFDASYIKEDMYVPYSKKVCDVNNSWVKVTNVNGKYQYSTYLKCGYLSSNIDHEGPVITLNGSSEITINKGEKYEDAGVKSIADNKDGKIKTNEVQIKGKVDTSKVGTYEITYSAKDSLLNETKVIRKVKVIETINNVVKNSTDKTNTYKGTANNNYIKLGGVLYRILRENEDGTVRVISSIDLGNANYDKIDEWLEEYYKTIPEETKKYLVNGKYCTDNIEEANGNIITCSKTRTDKIGLPSIDDYNKSVEENNGSYLYPYTLSWISNAKGSKENWTTRAFYVGTNTKYMSFDKKYNFGVRPVLTLKGKTDIISGDGTVENPYKINDISKAKIGDNLNTRYAGEYVTYSGYTWRIIKTDNSKDTKAIMTGVVKNNMEILQTRYETEDEAKIYNPTQKGNIGYYIENNISKYINTKYLVNKNYTVNIYDDIADYQNSNSKKTYKAKYFAPSIYDIFSSKSGDEATADYWYSDSSKTALRKYFMSNNGTVYYNLAADDEEAGVKLVTYFSKDCVIAKGEGTVDNPYSLTK